MIIIFYILIFFVFMFFLGLIETLVQIIRYKEGRMKNIKYFVVFLVLDILSGLFAVMMIQDLIHFQETAITVVNICTALANAVG